MYYHLTPLQRKLVALSLIALTLGFLHEVRGPRWDSLTADVVGEGSSLTSHSETTITVHVTGAVAEPGVYVLGPEDRVWDAIASAGGVLPAADPEALNLAAPLTDGERIEVPRVKSGSDPGKEIAEGVVDLNRADAEDLVRLHGIGPVLAERILGFREELGGFSSVEDLLDVRGIGEVTLDGIRDEVTVD